MVAASLSDTPRAFTSLSRALRSLSLSFVFFSRPKGYLPFHSGHHSTASALPSDEKKKKKRVPISPVLILASVRVLPKPIVAMTSAERRVTRDEPAGTLAKTATA